MSASNLGQGHEGILFSRWLPVITAFVGFGIAAGVIITTQSWLSASFADAATQVQALRERDVQRIEQLKHLTERLTEVSERLAMMTLKLDYLSELARDNRQTISGLAGGTKPPPVSNARRSGP